MIAWVIGRGGLLGRAISTHLRQFRDRGVVEYVPDRIAWESVEHAKQALQSQARVFEREAGRDRWVVIWAAGRATTSTAPTDADVELEVFTALVDSLRSALPRGPGAFFLSSSAGGVYAGSAGAPFSATTIPHPLSPYGGLKLAQEKVAQRVLGSLCPVAIGRISNLYGPGQDLGKLQGLISRLALAAVTQQPINIFVSLDTIRDYLYASDAGDMAWRATRYALDTQESRLDIIASGQPTTIGQLIRTMNGISKRRVPVALGTHPSSVAQSRDLRLQATILATNPTPIPVGMKCIHLDILQ